MRTSIPLAVVVAGVSVVGLAGTASAATKTPAKATTVCAVAKDGKVVVEAKAATGVTAKTAAYAFDVAKKVDAKGTIKVGRSTGICVAPGTYTLVVTDGKKTTTVKKVVVKKDVKSSVKVTVH